MGHELAFIGANPAALLWDGDRASAFVSVWQVDWSAEGPGGAVVLCRARSLAPRLREQAAENERLRRLSPETVDGLRSAGAFRLPMPAAWGGPEVDILTQTEIIETLSAADGSAGWCAMIGSDSGFYSAFLDDG